MRYGRPFLLWFLFNLFDLRSIQFGFALAHLFRTRFRMRRLISSTWIFLTLTGALSCSRQDGPTGAVEQTAAQPVRIKMVSSYPMSTPIIGENVLHMIENVRVASEGTIAIKVFDPGKLVSALEVLDAVSAGKVEAGYSTAGFWMGKIPASPFFSSVPFGPDINELIAWLYGGNGMELYQEMYDHHGLNVKVLVCGMIPPETSGWFAHEINSPEDLRGIKMRFFGLGGRVMEKLGVAVNLLPQGEIFPALEKGVIDATEYSLPSSDESLGFYKVVKYNYYPGWHQQASAFEMLVNNDVWDGLSASQQTVLELACRETILFSIAKAEAIQTEVMTRNAQERGVHNLSWSPEMLELFREKWAEVITEQSESDPFFKKVYGDLAAFRERYAVWGSKAYLPRLGSAP